MMLPDSSIDGRRNLHMPLSFLSSTFLHDSVTHKLKKRRCGARLAPANRVVERRRFTSRRPHFYRTYVSILMDHSDCPRISMTQGTGSRVRPFNCSPDRKFIIMSETMVSLVRKFLTMVVMI